MMVVRERKQIQTSSGWCPRNYLFLHELRVKILFFLTYFILLQVARKKNHVIQKSAIQSQTSCVFTYKLNIYV